MGRPRLTFWWRKQPPFTVDDDIRFVASYYRAGGPWTAQRIVYRLASRTGIVLRLRPGGPCWFFGAMTMADRVNTFEPVATIDDEARNG